MAQTQTAIAGLVMLLAAGMACGLSIEESSRSEPRDGGFLLPDGGLPAEPERCPAGTPKVGEACSAELLETPSCTYEVGSCRGPDGTRLGEYVNYCCAGGIWTLCGGTSECDGTPPVVPDAVAPAVVDSAAPAVDSPAPADGPLDASAPDGAAGAPDAAPDTAPDAGLKERE